MAHNLKVLSNDKEGVVTNAMTCTALGTDLTGAIKGQTHWHTYRKAQIRWATRFAQITSDNQETLHDCYIPPSEEVGLFYMAK